MNRAASRHVVIVTPRSLAPCSLVSERRPDHEAFRRPTHHTGRCCNVRGGLVLAASGTALATVNPSTGQPNQTCLSQTAPNEPGNAANAPGSAFNEVNGTAGSVYAGNGVSATTAGSTAAVSQYDVACFQVSSH
jgi:hypothetical protein